MQGVEVTAWMTVGYAVVLLLAAYGIDALARRSAAHVEQHRAGGFSYHEDHDAWLCPQDQWLWPTTFDPDNRVMRYRGSPSVCNACPVKDTCTTSNAGREVSRPVDQWPASEAARFHRGIACVVVVIAVIWPLAMALAAPSTEQAVVLVVAAFVVAVGGLPLFAHLRRSPAVPHGVVFTSLDDNVAQRAQVAEAQLRRRSSYSSDRRPSAPRPGEVG